MPKLVSSAWYTFEVISLRKVTAVLLLLPLVVTVFLIVSSNPGGWYYCYDCIGQVVFGMVIGLPLFAVGFYLLLPHGEGRVLRGLKIIGGTIAALAIVFALYIGLSLFLPDFLLNSFGINL